MNNLVAVIAIKPPEHNYNIQKDNIYYIRYDDVQWINTKYARNYFYIYNDNGVYLGLLHNSAVITLAKWREERINQILENES